MSNIPDKLFIRDPKVPITNVDIRTLVLAKLKLFPGAVVYDVGAGSGSVTVEVALQIPQGKVFGLESKPLAVEVAQANIKKFAITNGQIIPGDAVDSMPKLPPADRIFIGGSGGRLPDILAIANEKLTPGGLLVATSVTMHTGPQVHQFMLENGYLDLEVLMIQISRIHPVGQSQIWRANNPIQIITGTKPIRRD